MGLDMYLSKKTYVKNWSFEKPEEHKKVTVKIGNKLHQTIQPKRVSYIIEDVAYWRKANHIHQWFVDNVQEGEDDCKEYYVSRDDLQTLLDTCIKVLDNSKLVKGNIEKVMEIEKNGKLIEKEKEIQKIEDPSTAIELLPTQEGFFFGGTDYDEYYYNDLVYTRDTLTELLKEKDSGDFYYQSSW